MGQSKNQSKYRDGDSSNGNNILSPTVGTVSNPMRFLPYAIAVFGMSFVASCITASIMTPVQNSDAATQVDINATQVQYYVNIATASNTISKDIQATYAGTLGIVKDTLTVRSNTPDGYKVYLSMANNDNEARRQRLVNTEDASYYLNPVNGSLASPSNLTTPNTWGVAVASTYNSNFDNASSYTDATVTQTTKFAPVPVKGQEELLITRTGDTRKTGAESDITKATEDSIDVYYGYHANSGLKSGTYSNTVLYTAYAEASDQQRKIATFSPSKVDSYKTSQRITFTTTLYTNRTINNNQATVTIGDNACTNVTVSKVGSGNDTVTVSCDAPIQTRPGNYDAIISIPDYGHTSYASIPYDTPGITIASGPSAGTYKEMQEMTSDICEAWDGGLSEDANWDTVNNRPKPFKGGDTPVYRWGSDLSLTSISTDDQAAANWNTITATINATAGPSISNINDVVPDAFLKDARDNNFYHIRKLADGNCWMTDNLRLTWVAGDNIVTADGSTWQPHNTTETATAHTAWNSDPETSSSMSQNERASQYDHSYYGGTLEVGVHYNWLAATAGSGTYAMGYLQTADNSICPLGWQLPDKDGGRSFENLVTYTYGDGSFKMGALSDNNMSEKVLGAKLVALVQTTKFEPLNIVRNGAYYHSGNLGPDGITTWYHTNTANENDRIFSFHSYDHISSTYLYPKYTYSSSYKGYGMGVRCVL